MTNVPDLGSRYITTQYADGVLRLQVDRVERRNAFTMEMYRALKRAAVWADGNLEVDAVLLTGTGDWFAAGGDMAGRSEDPDGLAAEWDSTDNFPFRHIERCRALWVAAVNGLCHAGGVDLLLHCDVVVAADTATFRVPELLRGIPDPMLTSRLPFAVGMARARYLIYTGARWTAQDALAAGLVGEVVPHAELASHVDWVLAQIRLTGPHARAAAKRDMSRWLPVTETPMFLDAIRSAEMREGMRSFVEKRDPVWPR